MHEVCVCVLNPIFVCVFCFFSVHPVAQEPAGACAAAAIVGVHRDRRGVLSAARLVVLFHEDHFGKACIAGKKRLFFLIFLAYCISDETKKCQLSPKL